LRALVGIDPASVPVYRGELAARLAQAHAADAVTIGGQVMLAAGQSTAGPSGAALLAHELTHVARHRQPRFVPPVLTNAGAAAGSPSAPPEMAVALTGQVLRPVAGPIDHDNEEAVAGSVERAVRHAAGMSEIAAGLDSAPHQVGVPAHQPLTDDDQPSGAAAWGGLPAPWEPLPAWLTIPAPAPSSTPPSTPAAYAAADHALGAQSAGDGRPALSEAASPSGGTLSGPAILGGPANRSGAGNLSAAGDLGGASVAGGPTLREAASLSGGSVASGLTTLSGAGVASGPHLSGAASLGGPGSVTGAANLGGPASLGGAASGGGLAGGGGGLAGGGDAALPVFAAEHGRDTETDTEADPAVAAAGVTPAPQANPHEGTVEPDLDALARQVYTVLRRRLASEQRRFG
jgi:uncharacterized protein DUF4157